MWSTKKILQFVNPSWDLQTGQSQNSFQANLKKICWKLNNLFLYFKNSASLILRSKKQNAYKKESKS